MALDPLCMGASVDCDFPWDMQRNLAEGIEKDRGR